MKFIKDKYPIPWGLSNLKDKTEILYKCPQCGEYFTYGYKGRRIFVCGYKPELCPRCHLRIDWSCSPENVTNGFRDKYWSLYKNGYKTLDDIKQMFFELYMEKRI